VVENIYPIHIAGVSFMHYVVYLNEKRKM